MTVRILQPDQPLTLRVPFHRRRAGVVMGYLGIFLLAALVAYLKVFSQFNDYDDEGYLLVSFQSFIRGGELYSHVFTQYGPFPYELWGALYRIFGQPVTPDNARFIVITVWLLIALFTGITVQRVTRSVMLGMISAIVGFAATTVIINEPMHPGGLAALMVAAIGAAATLTPTHQRLRMGVIGFLIAGLLLTKVNVGGATVLAICLTLSAYSPTLARRRWPFQAVSLVCVIVPLVVMSRDLGTVWAENLALVISLGAAGLIVTLMSSRSRPPVIQDQERIGTLIITFIATLAGISIVIVLLGTHPSDFVNGAVISPLGQRNAFTIPAPVPTVAVDLGILGLVGAIAAHLRSGEEQPLLGGAIRIAAGGCMWMWASGTLPISLTPDPGALGVCLAFAWLAARPPGGGLAPGDDRLFVRALIASVAILGVLVVYPVAGSQMGFATVPFVPAAGIVLSDGIAQLRTWSETRAHRDAHWFPGRVLLALAAVLAAMIYQVLLQPAVGSTVAYRSLTPLPFAGASRLRQPPTATAGLASVVRVIRKRCDNFVTLPGLNSFYLWAHVTPPTGFNATAWMYLFSSAQQRQVVGAILHTRQLCLIRNDQVLAFWTARNRPPPPRPLWQFLNSRAFRLIYMANGYQVLIRSS